MGERRTALPPGGSPVPGPPPKRRCCWCGGRCRLATGGGRLSAEMEGGVEALLKGGDVAHLSGGGATVEGGVTVPGREEESVGRPEESHRHLLAALLQGRGAGGPAGEAAGDTGQQ